MCPNQDVLKKKKFILQVCKEFLDLTSNELLIKGKVDDMHLFQHKNSWAHKIEKVSICKPHTWVNKPLRTQQEIKPFSDKMNAMTMHFTEEFKKVLRNHKNRVQYH